MKEPESPRVGLVVCVAMVVACMVGTGVFTSLGFQVGPLPSPFVIIVLWAVGGLIALCGALSYAELAAALPRSGGEYHFLGRIFHPSLGVMAGFVSVFVGFAAPIALGAIAFGKYASAAAPGIPSQAASVGIVLALTLVHSFALRVSGGFQIVATSFKVTLILVFLVAGFLLGRGADFLPEKGDILLISSGAFAVSLMFVSYAYSGWNAAVYIVGEVKDPARTLPRALVLGTLVVTVLYVLLNAMFLASAPMGEYAGKVEVGEVAARHLFGAGGGHLMSAIIAIGLISSLSALTWAGPRVAQTAGEDFPALRWLAGRSPGGIPVRALVFQTGVVLVLLLTATFESVLVSAQFALISCSTLTVIGLVVLRRREPGLARPFRCPWYPVVPLVFLASSLFTLGYAVVSRPIEALLGSLTLVCGLLLYFFVKKVPTQ